MYKHHILAVCKIYVQSQDKFEISRSTGFFTDILYTFDEDVHGIYVYHMIDKATSNMEISLSSRCNLPRPHSNSKRVNVHVFH